MADKLQERLENHPCFKILSETSGKETQESEEANVSKNILALRNDSELVVFNPKQQRLFTIDMKRLKSDNTETTKQQVSS